MESMLPANQRNVLLESSIHRGFQHSVRALGCVLPGPEVFDAETLQYLIAHLELSRDEIKNLREQLHARLSSAEVLTAEDLGDGRFSFLVRVPYQRHLVDLWLIYRRDVWKSGGVAALSQRPLWKRPRVVGSLLAVSYAVVAMAAGAVGQYQVGHDQQRLAALAGRAGYALVPAPGSASSTAGPGRTSAQSPAPPAPNGQSPTPPANPSVTFNLQMGMSASDVTQFLHDQGLIQDAAAFNQKLADSHVDQNLKPGTYTFHKGMTEDEIVQTLQKGPQS